MCMVATYVQYVSTINTSLMSENNVFLREGKIAISQSLRTLTSFGSTLPTANDVVLIKKGGAPSKEQSEK